MGFWKYAYETSRKKKDTAGAGICQKKKIGEVYRAGFIESR
jgi:hypothetical protein